jgi:hypothetical protein
MVTILNDMHFHSKLHMALMEDGNEIRRLICSNAKSKKR